MSKKELLHFLKKNITQILIVVFGILILIQQQMLIKALDSLDYVSVSTGYEPLEVEVVNTPDVDV